MAIDELAVKNGFIALAIEQRGMGERRPSERHQNAANMCEFEAHITLFVECKKELDF